MMERLGAHLEKHGKLDLVLLLLAVTAMSTGALLVTARSISALVGPGRAAPGPGP